MGLPAAVAHEATESSSRRTPSQRRFAAVLNAAKASIWAHHYLLPPFFLNLFHSRLELFMLHNKALHKQTCTHLRIDENRRTWRWGAVTRAISFVSDTRPRAQVVPAHTCPIRDDAPPKNLRPKIITSHLGNNIKVNILWNKKIS